MECNGRDDARRETQMKTNLLRARCFVRRATGDGECAGDSFQGGVGDTLSRFISRAPGVSGSSVTSEEVGRERACPGTNLGSRGEAAMRPNGEAKRVGCCALPGRPSAGTHATPKQAEQLSNGSPLPLPLHGGKQFARKQLCPGETSSGAWSARMFLTVFDR
ncbi:hypothetical protein BU26DRAFT_168887 [Trematosphaeria pertusa]|uniref:Uncharacterized protein n=1 Tax=Trematosphaeria pertusa TaxID=390896 RepID=A0A6A6HUC6_9PLEO|nr:uncharacterized protein BU26DRAFT_168887 [Trematosphaeria pertusa]KAF2241706.1 hypothetical protein BU26DRAFT_168887 [Trematosphaeria pertusa]